METPATVRLVLLKGDAVGRKYNSLGLSICSVPFFAILPFEFPLRDVHPPSASLFLSLGAAPIVWNRGFLRKNLFWFFPYYWWNVSNFYKISRHFPERPVVSVSQQIPSLLYNPMVHYLVHNYPATRWAEFTPLW